jgi:hypothetical protein
VLTMNTPAAVDRNEWEEVGQLTHELLHGTQGSDPATTANRAAALVRLLSSWLAAPVDLPEAKEGDDELVYELPDWPREQRDQLSRVLERESIEHTWEESDLIVDATDERRVDVLLDEAEGPDEPAVASTSSGENDYQAISDLFGACDRLAHRPADRALRVESAEAAARVRGLSVPYGVADSDWWQLRGRAGALADDLDRAADDDAIAGQAATLRDLLRAFL